MVCRHAAPGLAALLAGSRILSSHQVGRHEHVGWRVLPPVVEELIYLPQGETGDLAEGPSGSSSDMAIEERPIGYTGTGVGSPAAARFKPETSSTAVNKALKSSKVRPFSSWSEVRS